MGGKGISGDSGVRCQPQSKPIKLNLLQLAFKLLLYGDETLPQSWGNSNKTYQKSERATFISYNV